MTGGAQRVRACETKDGNFGAHDRNTTLDNFLSRCEHTLNAWAYAQCE